MSGERLSADHASARHGATRVMPDWRPLVADDDDLARLARSTPRTPGRAAPTRRSASTTGISATARRIGRDGDLRDRARFSGCLASDRCLRTSNSTSVAHRRCALRPPAASRPALSATSALELVGASATAPCASSPPATTTTPPRSRTAGTARTAAAAPRAPPPARRWPTPAPLRSLFAVAAPLHELEVVVAEAPEERLGPLRARARSRTPRTPAVASPTSARQAAEHRAVDRRT